MRVQKFNLHQIIFVELTERADDSQKRIVYQSFLIALVNANPENRLQLFNRLQKVNSNFLAYFMSCAILSVAQGALHVDDAAQLFITSVNIIWARALNEDLELRKNIFCDMQALPRGIYKKYQHHLPEQFKNLDPARRRKIPLLNRKLFWRDDVASVAAEQAGKGYGVVEQICEHLTVGNYDNARELIDKNHLDFTQVDKYKILERMSGMKFPSAEVSTALRDALHLPAALAA